MLRDTPPLLYSNHHTTSSSDLKEPIEAEVTGVISSTDINLSWLHPTKLYTCTGMGNGGSEHEINHSRYFQALSLWLAANKRAVVSKYHKVITS